jgi:hypothetical protein
MTYSMGIELFDFDGKKQLNILHYNSLSELVGKKIKVVVELKKATDLPEKLSHQI